MDAETALPAKRVNGRMWQRSLLFRLTDFGEGFKRGVPSCGRNLVSVAYR
jgi:hypothetical protein